MLSADEATSDNVTTFPHGRMTREQYVTERTRLRGLYGDSRKEAGARYEQALARLFRLSGWTLAELAKQECKGKVQVGRMMIFGRFLGFLETEKTPESSLYPPGQQTDKLPFGLHEKYFRSFWSRTEGAGGSSGGNERVRFLAVIRMMKEEANAPPQVKPSKRLGKTIATQFADGKWHDAAVIAKKLDEPYAEVKKALDGICARSTFKCTAESKEVAKTHHYRIFPQERQISTVELVEKLQPLLTVLAEQGRANMATMSPPTVAFHTAKIQELLNGWAGRPPKVR